MFQKHNYNTNLLNTFSIYMKVTKIHKLPKIPLQLQKQRAYGPHEWHFAVSHHYFNSSNRDINVLLVSWLFISLTNNPFPSSSNDKNPLVLSPES